VQEKVQWRYCIIHQNVDQPKGLFHIREEAIDLSGFGDVGLDGDAAAASFLISGATDSARWPVCDS